ncbi:MAG: antibiotic biosynthesis monooxygenase [Roseibium album]|uniref:Antibiotic biosynthesis monooxygenase n=1 Tax=Roseibium album TaxID=311410 RepID=A0A0M6ZAE1_9HYPH|nr:MULTISPECIES: antibiotic biosynthesis monooxygenase [Stappiaceae]MBG6142994.1 heme-degrading monooxygenase HmoA [Labrenzia sp. EL_142]MBG6165128.1 heme-degrading monooxygenase HmoA [Labrenzia sp. EL_195]MBG6205330.1 heme-degrading monooxygenase HmoA [Labrenzia sp. EL_13]MBG6206104.1 heme-degrading monooxygenase HmoA [Labrenzia sp. EL_126]MCR9061181.1 antibiotic biosynthesis monooxygenase [Paracoccaceae bacterium]
MIAVIFEVIPHADKKQNYLDTAAEIRPLLEEIDGFVSVERFQSLSDPEKLLSVSFFRDEEALNEWRRLTAHRKAQQIGRTSYFKDYRLRVAHVLRDYGMDDREAAPSDSLAVHG